MTKAEAENVLRFMVSTRERFCRMAERITVVLELNTFGTDALGTMLSAYHSVYASLEQALSDPNTVWADVFLKWGEPPRKRKHLDAFGSQTPSASGKALPTRIFPSTRYGRCSGRF